MTAERERIRVDLFGQGFDGHGAYTGFMSRSLDIGRAVES
jgi:hypothetical protein